MKKILVLFAIIAGASFAKAATVTWSILGGSDAGGYAYQFFIVGQNGVVDTSTVTSLLSSSTTVSSTSSYAWGAGTLASGNGLGSSESATSGSGQTLSAGDYVGFFVVYNSSSISSASSYVIITSTEVSDLSISYSDTSADAYFAAGSVSSYLASGSSSWTTIGSGSVPEPTSGLLVLLGLAGLSLKRKRA